MKLSPEFTVIANLLGLCLRFKSSFRNLVWQLAQDTVRTRVEAPILNKKNASQLVRSDLPRKVPGSPRTMHAGASTGGLV